MSRGSQRSNPAFHTLTRDTLDTVDTLEAARSPVPTSVSTESTVSPCHETKQRVLMDASTPTQRRRPKFNQAAKDARAAKLAAQAAEAQANATQAYRARVADLLHRRADGGPWLLQPFLRGGELVVADGDPIAASALAVFLAVSVAADRRRVLLLDTMFSLAIGAQIRAAETVNKRETGVHLRIIRGLIPSFEDSSVTFLNAINEGGIPDLIVIHGLGALCEQAQLDPTVPDDVARLFEALSGIQARLRGCAIVLLGGSDTALADAADRILKVSRSGENVTVTSTAEPKQTLQFRLSPVRDNAALVPVDQ